MARPPDAFLSYTRFDDQRVRGKISRFRNELADAVRAVTGEPFEIFQDVDGIGLGEHWPGKLDKMLDEVRFFIPILTPSYFKSPACRDELAKFLRSEKDKERKDLVIPIYYLDCDVLEEAEHRLDDPLATAIHERQRYDWRQLRHHGFSTRKVMTEIERLARAIRDARRRAAAPPSQLKQGPNAITGKPGPIFASASAIVGAPPFAGPEVKPSTVFRDVDAPWCPELVVIPPGQFTMGSPDVERRWAVEQGAQREWVDWERPQHRVAIPEPFAVGRYAVTRGQFAAFVEATDHDMSGGCWIFTGDDWKHDAGADWRSPRFEQTDHHPVVAVSWHDAKAYVEWLARETGQPYRLPSESEWEYACRAGMTTRYWWGDDPPTPEQANFGMKVRATTTVDTYPPNLFGLYDTHGNVLEWCEDCWNQGYAGGPKDGSAWTTGDCGRRVLRGGSWYDIPALLRSANRSGFHSGSRNINVGFRVARTPTS